mgnify:CR=1 FL=1
MAVDMLRVAITPEVEHTEEAEWITAILDAGWDYVHLRHPGATRRDMKRIIEDVPQRHHGKLRLHGHLDLIYEFNLGGVHLNSRCPEIPEGYRGPVSRSCHSLEEIEAYPGCDYVTLSPVFDSVSKVGYRSAFTHEQLLGLPAGKVVALGGVVPERVPDLKRYAFAGYAVLGYLWSAPDKCELSRRLREFEK